MSVLLITYDLNTPGQNYKKVLDYIKSFPAWARISESTYTIQTFFTPEIVRDALRGLMDGNDNVYVFTLSKSYAGFGPPNVNEWLAQTLTGQLAA